MWPKGRDGSQVLRARVQPRIILSYLYQGLSKGFDNTTQKHLTRVCLNSVHGVIRLPQVAQHAQLHAPVVLCEDRARWVESLWVGGVAERHIEPGRGVLAEGK